MEKETSTIEDGDAQPRSTVTQLYRHFDANGNLLYVGISISAMVRLSQHKDFSPWYADVARVEIENFPTRQDAMRAEREAVRTESPTHNIHHQHAEQRVKKQPLSERSRDLLEAKIVDFHPVYTLAEVADLLQMGRAHTARVIESGELGHVSWQVPSGDGTRTVVRVTGWQVIEYLERLSGGSL